MPTILQPYTWIIALAAFAGWTGYCVRWGDVHGFSAREVARIERELAKTNLRLDAFNAHDEAGSAAADELRQQGYDQAVSVLKSQGALYVVTPEMASAFNRVAR